MHSERKPGSRTGRASNTSSHKSTHPVATPDRVTGQFEGLQSHNSSERGLVEVNWLRQATAELRTTSEQPVAWGHSATPAERPAHANRRVHREQIGQGLDARDEVRSSNSRGYPAKAPLPRTSHKVETSRLRRVG